MVETGVKGVGEAGVFEEGEVEGVEGDAAGNAEGAGEAEGEGVVAQPHAHRRLPRAQQRLEAVDGKAEGRILAARPIGQLRPPLQEGRLSGAGTGEAARKETVALSEST